MLHAGKQVGRRIREHRIRRSHSIADLARVFGYSRAYVSQIETGQRPVPDGFIEKMAEWLQLAEAETDELFQLAGAERKVVKIVPADPERAALAHDFARAINQLPEENLSAFRALLLTAHKKTSTPTGIEALATHLRNLLKIDGSDDALRLVTDVLPAAEPNYTYKLVDSTVLGKVKAISDARDGMAPYIAAVDEVHAGAVKGNADALYVLLHEFAHFLVHRTRPQTMLPTGFSRYRRIEAQADHLARALALEENVVRSFKTPEDLSLARNVPLWIARRRMKDFGLWPRKVERVIEGFKELQDYLRRSSSKCEWKDVNVVQLRPKTSNPVQLSLFKNNDPGDAPTPHRAKVRCDLGNHTGFHRNGQPPAVKRVGR